MLEQWDARRTRSHVFCARAGTFTRSRRNGDARSRAPYTRDTPAIPAPTPALVVQATHLIGGLACVDVVLAAVVAMVPWTALLVIATAHAAPADAGAFVGSALSARAAFAAGVVSAASRAGGAFGALRFVPAPHTPEAALGGSGGSADLEVLIVHLRRRARSRSVHMRSAIIS